VSSCPRCSAHPRCHPDRGYKATVEPTISNEFATAAYRLGHSLLSPTLLRLDAQKQEIAAGNLSLADSFFQPQHITEEGIDVIMRGLTNGRAQELAMNGSSTTCATSSSALQALAASTRPR